MDRLAHSNPRPGPGDEFASRFFAPLVSYFRRRLDDRSQAEDLAQEALLRLIRAAEGTLIEDAERFVFKVAANLLADHRRRTRRHPERRLDVDQDPSVDEAAAALVDERSPERVALGETDLGQVLRALDELTELTRNIFVLFRLEHMKQKDIAALYGIAQSTVEKHVMRAVLHLTNRCGAP